MRSQRLKPFVRQRPPRMGVHAPDYEPIKHGPGPGDDPDEVPWYETRAEMLAAEAKAAH